MLKILNSKLLLLFVLFAASTYSQDLETQLIKKYAETSFNDKDYGFALENYLKLYENDKDNININFRIGVCYIFTNTDKTAAIKYLKFVVSHNNFSPDAYYYLGKSYMYAYQFTEAVESFYEYKASGVNNTLLADADHLIGMSYDALEFMNSPINVTFKHLDTTINTEANDYLPYLVSDGKKMLFSSDSRYIDELKVNVSDIYIAEKKKNGWSKAKFFEGNTYENEKIVGVSTDGDQAIIYSNGDFSTHDLSLVNVKRKTLARTNKNFPKDKINTKNIEEGACLNTEGDIIYFASNKPGGYGGFDLYKIVKNKDGKWGEPENLGADINSPYDDNYPTLSKDEKTLYFSSKGHKSIGGYDLFKAFYSDKKLAYIGVRPLGVPINTPYDNISISFEQDGKVGYLATTRKEGFGKLDIYKIQINSDASPIIIDASIMVGDKNNAVPYSDEFNKVFVTLYDKYGNIFARYPVQDNNFFASIFPGEYTLDVYIDGSKKHYREKLHYIDSGEDQIEQKTIYIQQ